MNKAVKKIKEHQSDLLVEEDKLKELEVLGGYEGDDRIVSSDEMRKRLEKMESLPKFSSKIKNLDTLLGGGFRPGELITITGITKSGKSTFARTLCSNFVANDINSVYFSYEETERELLEKFPKPYPIFYLPRKLSSASTDWIHNRIGEAKAKYGTQAVFIDNLDFLLNKEIYKRHGNLADLIKFVVVDLKNTARYWEVSIFLMAHTTQEGTRRGIELGDIKGSASIGQTSDFVFVVKRLLEKETKLPGIQTEVKIIANRRTGRVGKFRLIFEDNYLKEYEKPNL
ncbi:MAG: DnaB-like helicase C-terminal domain-containing protein [Candidatus Nealsonbacteria bacterium]